MDDQPNPDVAQADSNTQLGIRWWPAGLILTGGAVMLGFIWLLKDVHRQTKNLESMVVILAVAGMLLLWVLLLSRARWKSRLMTFGGVCALLGLLAGCFEIKGVSGDLLPVIGFRWQTEEPLPDLVPAISDPVANGPAAMSAADETQSPPTKAPPMDLVASSSAPLVTSAFPQFRGPDRNSIVNEPVLDLDWESNPPQELWRRKIGGGWAGFATFQHFAITLEQRGKREYVACYNIQNGKPIWSHNYESIYESKVAGDGPRTVPTIADGRVYTAGATGMLCCLELTTGKLVWSTNLLDDHDRHVPEWGYSASPLVFDNKVIVNPGGHDTSIAAYNATDGTKLWSGGSEGSHNSSPTLVELCGEKQILIFHNPRIVSHSVEDGTVLWEYEWFEPAHPNVTMPIVLSENRVLASAGYGEGTDVFKVSHDSASGWSANTVWRSNRLKSKFGAVVVVDGFAYGLDDGVFACIDTAEGKRQWKKGRYGHGQMLLVGDVFVMLTEKGDVVLIERNPDAHNEFARFSAFDSKTWNPPAIAGDLLLVRNDKEAACYRLPVRP